MSRSGRAFWLRVLACSALACACDDDATQPALDAGGEDARVLDDGALDAAALDDLPCDETYPAFTPGMSVPAGALTVKLLAIDPAPPRQKVVNDWVIEVVDASGAAVADVTIDNAGSYMVQHRHGGRREPKGAALASPGQLELSGIDFIMRGPWQVYFDVLRGGAKAGTATFNICVE